MRLLVAALFFVAASAEAALWDLSFSATAMLPSGETGAETVVYGYDTEAMTLGRTAEGWQMVSGPVLTVSYTGLVDGNGGPTTLLAIAGRDPEMTIGGTHGFFYPTTFFKNPFAADLDVQRLLYPMAATGGEDGWRWVPPPLLDPFAHFTAHAVPEPPILALLILGLFAIGLKCKFG